MDALKRLLHVIDTINEWVGTIASFLILIITGITTYEIVCRYVFNSPTEWSFELTGFLFLAYTVLGGGYTLLHEAHVNTDIFYSRLSARGKAILDLMTAVLFFVFAVAFTWAGWRLAWTATLTGEHSGTPWNPPVYLAMWVLPVGGLLLLIQGLAKFIRDLLLVATGIQYRPSRTEEKKVEY
ncbi:MAG: TRAP transporter small permease subunit [Betaproteobacteria bacterium]|nr:TRAP transporter small permease subunit [Betaproteobacteria bacterium]